MHLLIDVQAMQSPDTRSRGIGRYSRNLVAGLAAARPTWHIELVQSKHLEPIDPTGLPELPTHAYTPPLPFDRRNPEANENHYGDWLTAATPDAILVPSFFSEYALVPQFTGPRPRLFGVLHDLIPLLFPNPYLLDPVSLSDYARRFRRMISADCLLSNSEATRQDFLRILPGDAPRVVTIGGAADASFRPPEAAEFDRLRRSLQRKFGLGREFVFYVGGSNYRKNPAGAVRAFAGLPEPRRGGLELAIAGELIQPDREKLWLLAREFDIPDSLRLLGHVTDAELRALYQLCRVFFFPSLYEGLGLPVLEALRCGAPVVCSDRSALPEAAGPASWLADPDSPERLAEALAAALAEPRDVRLEERLTQARRFSWEKTAELAACVIHTPVAKTAHSRRRLRIAWAAPMPPARSGVADYSAELLGPLSDRYDIELVVDPEQPPLLPELADRHVVVLGRELAARHDACPYDLFIYHVGNSPLHLYMCDLMHRFRGLVVLHDYFVGELVLRAIDHGIWQTTLDTELAGETTAELTRHRAGGLSRQQLVDRVPLNRRVLTAADAVIVHTAWTWQRVRERTQAPVARIPHHALIPSLGSREDERARLGLPQGAFLIATLGFVATPKRILVLFQAVAGLPAELKGRTKLLVVGGVQPVDERELLALANRLGIAAHVRFTGHVPLGDFAAYARAADVCVQLRYPTRGEAPGSLLRAMSSGTACVISDHGPMAEVPEEAALRVRTPDHEIDDLRAALRRLDENPALRNALGQAAVKFLREQHSIDKTVEQYALMIEETASQRRSRDALWTERVCESLALWPDSAIPDRLFESWAELRSRGQQAIRSGRQKPRDRQLLSEPAPKPHYS